jgi:hypothetical protein
MNTNNNNNYLHDEATDSLSGDASSGRIPRVLIEVSGGVCLAVHSDSPILYKIKDWDNIEGGDRDSYLASLGKYRAVVPEMRSGLDEIESQDV